jgi:predicted transcriptional regulator
MSETTEIDTEDRIDMRASVREGIEDADAGRVTPYEKVRRWLLSWGSDKELPPPECP